MAKIASLNLASEQQQLVEADRIFLLSLKADSLDKLICGSTLVEVVNAALMQFETHFESGMCVVFAPAKHSHLLDPFAFPSISAAHVSALKNHRIQSEEDECGRAFFTGQTEHIDKLFSQPLHAKLLQAAKHNGIKRCLSIPLKSIEHKCLGALDCYLKPSVLTFCEQQTACLFAFAQLLSQLFERGLRTEQYSEAQILLSSRIEEQNRDYSEIHKMLEAALAQRDEVRNKLVKMEKSASIGTMLSSITHEMNAPIGVSLTAVTHLQRLKRESYKAFQSNQLKKSELDKFYSDCEEACVIAERNLARAANIVSIFKQLSVDQYNDEKRVIKLTDYICEILLSLKPTLKSKRHVICIDVPCDMEFESYPAAFGQILINFIMNSVEHGFAQKNAGRIVIKARIAKIDSGKELVVTYSDNGKGMDENTLTNIYRPFFTKARHKGGSGLGMHICYNLAVNMLKGSIECESQPNLGTSFTVKFPITSPSGFIASA